MVFRGNIGPWYNPKTKEFHVSRKDAIELLSISLESFKEKSEKKEYPKEILFMQKLILTKKNGKDLWKQRMGKVK